ncbi:hypothetical protein [Microvirga brassicacearum]|uniref:Uncharacterized protein n=1 Tax=Microvirga brassicacearum TaxID=2580413 RepID=A0A5N3P982_9HYPH|nr:hypothetical protein [Microvirga brassicacearum]KAB0266277.1 hypothetical protein FEZ63_14410 [Microvirga brassicacearum]
MSNEIDFALENRRSLSGPGLRTFLVSAGQWGLTEAEQVRIVGDPPVATFCEWVAKAREQQDLILGVEVLMRISAVLGIYGSLATLGGSKAMPGSTPRQ